LGFLGDLKESTLKYLGAMIQPTLARFKSDQIGGKFTRVHAEDLMRHATIKVEPNDWPYMPVDA
jgi:hypothetical protein